jgi:hypothetical protein
MALAGIDRELGRTQSSGVRQHMSHGLPDAMHEVARMPVSGENSMLAYMELKMMRRLFSLSVVLLAVVGTESAVANPYNYRVVQATSSAVSAALALNFARGNAAALCWSRFHGTLIGFPRSTVLKRGTLYSATVSLTCQSPG